MNQYADESRKINASAEVNVHHPFASIEIKSLASAQFIAECLMDSHCRFEFTPLAGDIYEFEVDASTAEYLRGLTEHFRDEEEDVAVR